MKPTNTPLRVSLVLFLVASAHSAADGPQEELLVSVLEPGTTSLVYGCRTINGAIEHPFDSDAMTFIGATGDRIRIRVMTETATLDPQCELLSPTGARLDFFSATAGASGCVFERNPALLVESGLFRILINDRDQNDSGTYVLQLERVPPSTIERVIGYDRLATDTLDSRIDMDAFRTEMIAGVPMRITMSGTSGGLDPLYELYDPDGNRIDSASASNGIPLTRNVTPTTTGTYSVLMSDRDLNETGDFSIIIVCTGGTCPPTAFEIVRNGSGVNPLAYSVECPAVLGSMLALEVDATTQPTATRAILLFYAAGGPGTASRYGEILVDQSSSRLGKLVAPVVFDPMDGVFRASYQVSIPADHSLAGIFTSSQGILIGSSVQLTNAIDLTVGF
jgi:hypothetical protein